MNIKDLKKELKRLKEAEEKLLTFLMQYPEHRKEAVEKIFEVCSLIVDMERIIKEMKKKP